MKYRNYIYVWMVVFTTLIAWWIVPSLVRKMTDASHSYPLMYYSARLKELCIIDFREMTDAFKDAKGNVYARSQYDSLLPLLNARQLMMDGKLPDSINGHALDMKEMRIKQVMFRHRPVDMQTVQAPMGVLLEAMPKRGNLTLPGDYFTLTDKIEFIDAETNRVDAEKSERFNNELKKKGFSFPAQGYWGNPSTRKAYEEGYFCLDAEGALFHLKMVNGRPFVKNTYIGDSLDVAWVVMNEATDKRHYAFVFGKQGVCGIIEEKEGGYYFRKMDIRSFNPAKDQLTVMGNMLYWTVNVINEEGMDSYGLDRETLECLSFYHQARKRVLWDEVAEWLFPCYLSLEHADNAFIRFYWTEGSWKAIGVHLILAIVVWGIGRRRRYRKSWVDSLYVLLGGIPAMVAWYVLPDWRK